MSVKALVKSLIPTPLMKRLSAARTASRFETTLSDWDKATSRVVQRDAQRPVRRVLVVPSDTETLIGALGDDAMISAIGSMCRLVNPTAEIVIVIQGTAAAATARSRGLVPLDIWGAPDFMGEIVKILNAGDIDAAFALGADVMDGYYSPIVPARIAAVMDLARRSGIPATILGFSFNNAPYPGLSKAFDRMHSDVQVCLRDEISLERFRRFSSHPARLVADSAFMLVPSEPAQAAADWVAARRAAGDRVIGVNLHPMLIRNATPEQVNEIIRTGAEALLAVAAKRPVSWFLLPHDYRGELGDARCLEPIRDAISGRLGERVRYLEGMHLAADLKGLAGVLDGIVTGRMHLAIGSLGQGTPTVSVTYQDKFEGLYRHFGLPDWMLLSPQRYLTPGSFEAALIRFLDEIDQVTAIVENRVGAVKDLSRDNFSSIL